MLPMRFFRSRAFSATNGVSLAMYFGMFGSIFLLAQFFQTAQGYSPLEAGLRTLPWTAMPIFVAPMAGLLSDRIGSRPLMFSGPGLQAAALVWFATILEPAMRLRQGRRAVHHGRHRDGAGVRAGGQRGARRRCAPTEAGQASGATNAIREVGGVLGVAVLATVFTSAGSFVSPQAFSDGLQPALLVGAAVLALGAIAALLVPGKERGAGPGARCGRRLTGPRGGRG